MLGVNDRSVCRNCNSTSGKKLGREELEALTHRFFVWGTLHRCEYGAAPIIQFNQQRNTEIEASPWFESDLRLIERVLGVGFFYYGPRLWMVGEVEPLKDLSSPVTQTSILKRITTEYPAAPLKADELFYRLRIAPKAPAEQSEYDSPPLGCGGIGRLDAPGLQVMYASQDLEVCIHECRVTAEDELFVATLTPSTDLRLLDLTSLLFEEDVTEFESLDMAVHMLFLAGKHSYDLTRKVALAARTAGFDGIVYPSYFSLLRTGGMPFETVFGISHRQIPELADRERSKTIPNIAIFGRPIADGRVRVVGINRLILNRVEYQFHFGPVGYQVDPE
ncbi:hypothetical protein CKO39_03755 [Rhodopseudomonas palustris]|nr:hypothetical protein CKO39_03755 [Rhodopseudomonas palustris]